MHTLRAAVLAALALSTTTGPSTADTPLKALTDRSDLLGWEAVGRLDLGTQAFCSAVLIAPDTLMTAAHCLVDPATGERQPVDNMVFRAGWRDGEVIATRRVRAAIVPDAFVEAGEDDPEKVRYDVGLLRLANPIPATTAAPYGVGNLPAAGTRVTVVSYGLGRSNSASRQSGCQVLAANASLAAFGCAGEPGSSGAPVFTVGGGHPVIISLISSGTQFEGQDAVLGMNLPGVTEELLANLRAGVGTWPTRLPDARRVAAGDRSAGGARFLRP